MPGWRSRHTEMGHIALEVLVVQVVHEDLDFRAHPELQLLLENHLYLLQEFLLDLEQTGSFILKNSNLKEVYFPSKKNQRLILFLAFKKIYKSFFCCVSP